MSGIAGTTGSNIVILLAGIGSGVTLARSLGPAGRGELAIALLWPTILILLVDLGLGFAFSYYAGKGRDSLDGLWTLALLAGTVLGSAAALLGWLWIPHFVPALRGSAHAAFVISLWSVPVMLTSGYEIYLLLGKGFVAEYNLVRLTPAIANLLTVVVVAGLGWVSVQNYAAAYVLSQSTGLALCTYLVVKRFHPVFQLNPGIIPKVFAYGFKVQVASLAGQTTLRADQTVMSMIFTPQQLGLYVVAVAISGILAPFLNALAIVVLPRTTHAANDLSGALLIVRHVKLALLFSLPVLLASVILMPWLLPAFFGRAYAPAVLSAQVLVVAGLFQGLNAVLGNSLRGLGRPSRSAMAEVAGMMATILLLFWLLPVYGILGAAIASVLAYFLVGVIQVIFVAQASGLKTIQLMSTPLDFPVAGRSRQLWLAIINR